MADIFRSPLFTPIPKRPTLVVEVFRNTLLLAALVASTPFHAVDTGTPFRARAIPQADIPPNTLLAGIPTPPVPLPLVTVDWPQAPVRKSIRLDDPPNLLTAQLQAAVLAPFGQSDWPTPFARKPTRFDDAPNLLTSSLIAAAKLPFVSIDVGQPSRARIAPLVEPVPNSLILGIPQIMPFGLDDWPQPYRARQPIAEIPPNVALNSPLVATLPFRQTDWPLAPPKARSTPYGDIPPNSTLIGIPVAVAPLPLITVDWPQWIGRKQLVIEPPPNLLLGTLAAIRAPFAQYDWPTPLRVNATRQADSVGNTPKPAPVVLPFRLNDWPQPYRIRQRIDAFGWVASINLGLSPPVSPPFTPPRVIVYPSAERTIYLSGDRVVYVGRSRTST